MAKGTLDRWLLVNYSGYPFALNSLILDNGLANLAGSLMQDGKSVEIMDCATVSMLERLTPAPLRKRLQKAWSRIFPADGHTPTALEKAGLIVSLQYAEWYRQRRQQAVLHEIAVEIAERIRARDIQAVGFKLWNGDGIQGSAIMAREIRKRCPDVRIFGGGPQVDVFMGVLFQQCDAFDALAYGEGEWTIKHLAEKGDNPAAYASIPNLVYRADGEIHTTDRQPIENLDDIPLPVYDSEVYPTAEGTEKVRIIVIDDSRGCGNNCAFCIHPVKSGHNRSIRMKSVDKLVGDIRALQKKYGVSTYRFAGSCTPYSLLNGFAAEALRSELNVAYASFAHIRNWRDAEFETMRASGCEALFFGIESGSQRVLNAMRKGTKTEDIAPAIHKAKDAGIYTVGSLIFPAPREDDASEEETLEMLKTVRPDGLTIQPPLIVPRTDWYNRPERYGIEIPDRAAYDKAAMRWKAKNLLPVDFWASVPVSVNGLSFKDVLKKTSAFTKRCEANGLTTCVSDDTHLMALRCDMTPVEFRDVTRRAFFAGDAETVRGLAETINPRM